MDTLAALAFGGEPALDKFMKEKPKRRDEPIVSSYMWSSILVGSLWTFALSLVFIFALKGFFPDTNSLLTGYFAFFIFTSVFNAFNARTEEINLFKNMKGNKGFLKILGLIAAVQIILTYIGGNVFQCHGLTIMEWLVVLGMSISIIPIDLIRKAICKKALKK